MLCGLQGSGKTTLYRERFLDTHVRISMDLLRTRGREADLLEWCLRTHARFVVDNTNPTPAERAELIALARSFGAGVVGYYFESSLADCLERNRGREGKARVPDVALHVTRRRLVPPTPGEGFDRLYFVRLLGEGRFDVRDWKEGDSDEAR